MSGFGQKGPVFIQLKSGKPASWFSLLLLVAGGLFLLVFGVWLLLIVATLLILLMPYLWWKKRKLVQQMQDQMHRFRQSQPNYQNETTAGPATANRASESAASGLVIEGEVLQKRQED